MKDASTALLRQANGQAAGVEDIDRLADASGLSNLNTFTPYPEIAEALRGYAYGFVGANPSTIAFARSHAIRALGGIIESPTDSVTAAFRGVHAVSSQPMPEAWPEPMPLSSVGELPAFPLAALPAWAAIWAEAESTSSQTPVDLAAMLALSVIATCVQRRVEIHGRSDWREQLCLFVCVVLETGARKSPVFAKAFSPVYEYEKSKRERLAEEIADTTDKVDVARKRLEAAKIKAAKSTDVAGNAEADSDVELLRERLTAAEKAQIRAPELICGDVTQEALAILLSQQNERMTLADAEGCGPIAIMLGRYSDKVNVDLFLRAYSGDRHSVHRANKDREPIVLHMPALTIALTIQPDGLSQLGEHERLLRGLGFIARFAFSVPSSMVGFRDCDPPEVSADIRDGYAACICELLAIEAPDNGEPHPLFLEPGAKGLLLEFRKDLEAKLRPDGEHASRRDWCAKYPGLVLRVAGLLHCADHRANPWEEAVSVKTIERAIEIGEYLLAHASVALEQIQTTPTIRNAENVLGWIKRANRTQFSKRDVFNALRGAEWCKRVDALDEPLAVLVERGWIRELPAPVRSGPGRSPSPEYEASPYTQNTRNPQNSRARHGPEHSADSADDVGGRDAN